MDRGKALTALAAMANETRLDILRGLIVALPGDISAGEIARRAGMSASRLSFHLASLEQAGLIASRREARNVFYRAETAAIGALMEYLLNDCCKGHPDIRDCCAGAWRTA